jgi:hypothetical protein
MIILKEGKSEKLVVKIDSPRVRKFIENIIKEYKLSSSNKDYILTDKSFTLFNTKQYTFTDIRNDLFKKKISYDEI